MDMDAVREAIAVLAAAVPDSDGRGHVLRELDRLAELLVGLADHGAPAVKLRIQELIVTIGRGQTAAVTTYIEMYCR